ncbi:ABC transporter substrate-binding protein [Lachnoclostridium phytofermentans]|uniref:Extracellular solute-binding protein family 5 n=1 Tax=Lachnoclostridium phytofermentans (strain ATCC 700394 / DSM 18823 / ISDg) TaxID=357809 RepID=A9KKM1_LACP7|nr:ABC transporter substrate-binding protein [Lachnoclostridium phytofermentans]ABX41192.1 extracellular solute-binding protein family 5 [Lachnoclostridium phytofermentans ISDg]
MKKTKKLVALLLCMTMILSLAACSKKEKDVNKDITPTVAPTSAAGGEKEEEKPVIPDVPAGRRDASTPRSAANEKNPLVISTLTLDGKFTPFFGTSEPDRLIYEKTQITLIANNETAEPVAGVDVPTAAWDFKMTTNDDQSKSTYKFWIKNGVQFSDGHVLTVDDVLFNLYVLLDPKYDGSSTLYSMHIEGLKAYQTQILDESSADAKLAEFAEAAKKKVDAALAGNGEAAVTDKLWELVKESVTADSNVLMSKQYVPEDFGLVGPEDFLTSAPQSIILYYTASCIGRDLITYKDGAFVIDAATGLTVDKMSTYTEQDYIDASMKCIKETINAAEFDEAFDYTTVDDAKAFFAGEEKSAYLEANKGTVKSISGITKGKEVCSDGVERETLTVVLNGVDPKAIWNFTFEVAPMHYYAGQARHDKANGVDYFGVDFSSAAFMLELKEFNGLPMGAGAYKMTDANNSENPTADKFYDNGICYFVANDNFLLGAPKVKYLRYKTINAGSELDSVLTGDVHYSDPKASATTINKITSDSSYSHMNYVLVDNLGYGYIGINAQLVPDLNVRRALMSAMDTALTLGAYPGGLAQVIHRPMSQVSWAYPEGCTAMYPFDETGAASKAFFLKAGYKETADGKLLAPDGSKPSFKFTLPSSADDHPAGQVFLKTQEVLEKIGVEVIIDIDQNLLSKLNEGIISVWAAAWQATIDPDMFQVYCSDPSKNQATSPKSSGLYYKFENGSDEEKAILVRLNELIEQGRSTLNVDERKPIYSEALDKAMEMAVELPTYQRKNMYVYNKSVIDPSSLTPADKTTPYRSPIYAIWDVSLLDN